MLLEEVFNFLKKPVYQEDENTKFKYRFRVFKSLLLYTLLFSFFLGMILAILERGFSLDFGQHAVEGFLTKYHPLFLLFAAVILAPMIEEFIFRGPLVFFKGRRGFPLAFYLVTLIFGFVHLANFGLNATILMLSPLLVAPQLCAGVFLGFIRVRFGLLWSMGLHACYNLILAVPVVAGHLMEPSLQ